MRTVLRYSRPLAFTSGCRVATGRSAILHLIERYKPTSVLMPCYVPDGVIRPFHHANVEVRFYRLDQWMRPDEQDLGSKLAFLSPTARPLVVVIHYFGYRQPTEQIAHLTHAAGGILLEDCAHCLPGPAGVGQDGDAVLYSFNKFLPVADGALLCSRNSALDLSITDHLAPLPRNIMGAYQTHLEANARLAAASSANDAEAIGVATLDSKNAYDIYYDHINSDMSPHAQSAESRMVEAQTDFSFVRHLRRMKAMDLEDRISERFVVCPHVGATQFAYPIRCGGKRREIDAALYREGILTATLTDRWDHVQPGFDIECEFYDDHLLLPIGEDTTPEDIITMAEVLGGF